MSAVAEPLDVNALIPDGIEPVEAMRCWRFANGELLSLNGEVWTPGEPLVAVCRNEYAATTRWSIVRRGLTYEQASERKQGNDDCDRHAMTMWSMYSTSGIRGNPKPTLAMTPAPPMVALPDGYGFELEAVTHDCPDEGCSCGIYAATTEAQLPDGGTVYGKANLWGKVVPGKLGVRAQYAYPSEFEVPASLADHPALKAFGVPIKTVDRTLNPPIAFGGFLPFVRDAKPKMHWSVKVAVTVNVAAAAFNFSHGLGLW